MQNLAKALLCFLLCIPVSQVVALQDIFDTPNSIEIDWENEREADEKEEVREAEKEESKRKYDDGPFTPEKSVSDPSNRRYTSSAHSKRLSQEAPYITRQLFKMYSQYRFYS